MDAGNEERNEVAYRKQHMEASGHATEQELATDSLMAVGCKWVFKIKRYPSGEITKCKARVVAKEFLSVLESTTTRPLH